MNERMKTNKSETVKKKAKQTKSASCNSDAARNSDSDAPVMSGTDGEGKDTGKNVAVMEGAENAVMPTSVAPTTPQEAERLAKFEAIIEKNCKSLFALGEALQVIRDERLYRDSFDTFQEYCHAKWAFSRTWAHFQITAATTRATLLTVVNKDGLPEPTNERQLRPLSKLKPEAKAAAWRLACQIAGDSEINHSHVERAVAEIKGEAPGSKSNKRRKEKRNERPTTPSSAGREKGDDAQADSGDAQTEDRQSQSDPTKNGLGAEDEVDEKLVSAACGRINDFVADQIKMLSGPERAKVADQLRALADRICA